MGKMSAGAAVGPRALGATLQGSRPRSQEADDQLHWVLAAQNGDTSAFNRLVLLWQQRIYNLALRTLGDAEEAAEATQETFLSAFKHVRRFRLESRFSTWLYSIASNECRSRLRRQAVRQKDSMESRETGLREEPLTIHDWEGEMDERARQQRVRRELLALPSDERLALELKFYQECTFEEISAILEAPLSTVKTRFYRGLERLKECLTEISGEGF